MAMTPEGKVKAAIKKALKEAGIWFYMPVQNGMGRVGIPDFICCAAGKFVGIEAKAPGKGDNVTANQRRVHDDICSAGGWTFIVDDAQQMKEILTYLTRRRLA